MGTGCGSRVLLEWEFAVSLSQPASHGCALARTFDRIRARSAALCSSPGCANLRVLAAARARGSAGNVTGSGAAGRYGRASQEEPRGERTATSDRIVCHEARC
jgi:hypothetical protein